MNNIYYRNFILFIIILIFCNYIINKNSNNSIERFNSNFLDPSQYSISNKDIAINNIEYTFLGFFIDNSPLNKLIPLRITNTFPIKSDSDLIYAKKIATSYSASVFGIQNNGTLYIGYNLLNAISLGIAPFSNNRDISSCINQVYVATTNYTYTYLGAYADKLESRAFRFLGIYLSSIPQVISKFPAFDIKGDFNTTVLPVACYVANLYGATVFGLQNNTGEFWIDYDKDKIIRHGRSNCNVPLGCDYANQVYIANQYIGSN